MEQAVKGRITVVGLGPGREGLITRETWQCMREAEHLILRTAIHPTVEALRREGLKFQTYDGFYEAAENFEALYAAIAGDLISRAAQGEDLVYAVPGSPLVAERTVVLLRQKMEERKDLALTILPGMSFVEILYTRLGVDPIDGLAILDAEDCARLTVRPIANLIVTQVYDARTASDAKLSLMELYPDDYEIIYVHSLAMPEESVRRIRLFELDRQKDIDHLTSVFVPAHA
jgi:tetrapyrrole methylase family protein/MazG family protein